MERVWLLADNEPEGYLSLRVSGTLDIGVPAGAEAYYAQDSSPAASTFRLDQ